MKVSDREELSRTIGKASREHSTVTVLFHALIAEQAGLGTTDHKALDILLRLGPLTAGEIAIHTGLTPSSVTSLIDRLERRGFVRRVHDSVDRRRILVEAIPEGLGELAGLFQPIQRAASAMLANYSEEQLETILDFLNRSTEMLRGRIDELSGGPNRR